jgi:hypothetical protein
MIASTESCALRCCGSLALTGKDERWRRASAEEFDFAHNGCILDHRLDADESGYITKGDIVDFLGGDIPQRYIDDIMAEADLNHDNKISYREVSLLCLLPMKEGALLFILSLSFSFWGYGILEVMRK